MQEKNATNELRTFSPRITKASLQRPDRDSSASFVSSVMERKQQLPGAAPRPSVRPPPTADPPAVPQGTRGANSLLWAKNKDPLRKEFSLLFCFGLVVVFFCSILLLMYPTSELSFHLKVIIIRIPVGRQQKGSGPLLPTGRVVKNDRAQGRGPGSRTCHPRAE